MKALHERRQRRGWWYVWQSGVNNLSEGKCSLWHGAQGLCRSIPCQTAEWRTLDQTVWPAGSSWLRLVSLGHWSWDSRRLAAASRSIPGEQYGSVVHFQQIGLSTTASSTALTWSAHNVLWLNDVVTGAWAWSMSLDNIDSVCSKSSWCMHPDITCSFHRGALLVITTIWSKPVSCLCLQYQPPACDNQALCSEVRHVSHLPSVVIDWVEESTGAKCSQAFCKPREKWTVLQTLILDSNKTAT